MTQLTKTIDRMLSVPESRQPAAAADTSRVCVALTGSADGPVLSAALQLATKIGGSLSAYFIPQRLDAYAYSAFVGPNLLPGRVAVDMLQAENVTAHAAARKIFDEAIARDRDRTPRAGAAWRGELAGAEELGIAARLMDFTVIAQPKRNTGDTALANFDAVLYRARRSALLVPPIVTRVGFDNVVIAFNGSAEASRAATMALPILRCAATVSIIAINPRPNDALSPEDLAEYLASHSVAARLIRDDRHVSVEKVVDWIVDAEKADLLVMGAYTHSHLRQMVLGGLTSHVIEHATVPVLMAH